MQKKRNMRGDPGSLDDEPGCSQDPAHPHGFDRNASHKCWSRVCAEGRCRTDEGRAPHRWELTPRTGHVSRPDRINRFPSYLGERRDPDIDMISAEHIIHIE